MSDTEQEPSMEEILASIRRIISDDDKEMEAAAQENEEATEGEDCLLYTSPSPRDIMRSRMPSSA